MIYEIDDMINNLKSDRKKKRDKVKGSESERKKERDIKSETKEWGMVDEKD